jgi:hypothetical protein
MACGNGLTQQEIDAYWESRRVQPSLPNVANQNKALSASEPRNKVHQARRVIDPLREIREKVHQTRRVLDALARQVDVQTLPGVPVGDSAQGFAPKLPKQSGVYFLCDPEGEVLYVGQARNLAKRCHRGHEKIKRAFERGDVVLRWLLVERESIVMFEDTLIRRFDPPWNVGDDPNRPAYHAWRIERARANIDELASEE